MEPDLKVTVMIEIAEGFAQDLHQEGDLKCRARQRDPAASNEAASWSCEASCGEGSRGGARGTAGHPLHAQQRRRRGQRDIDVSRVNELPLGLVSPSPEEELCLLSQ